MRIAVLHNLPRSQAGLLLPYSRSTIMVTTRDISRDDVVSILFYPTSGCTLNLGGGSFNSFHKDLHRCIDFKERVRGLGRCSARH